MKDQESQIPQRDCTYSNSQIPSLFSLKNRGSKQGAGMEMEASRGSGDVERLLRGGVEEWLSWRRGAAPPSTARMVAARAREGIVRMGTVHEQGVGAVEVKA